jgi:hypothetical protein
MRIRKERLKRTPEGHVKLPAIKPAPKIPTVGKRVIKKQSISGHIKARKKEEESLGVKRGPGAWKKTKKNK